MRVLHLIALCLVLFAPAHPALANDTFRAANVLRGVVGSRATCPDKTGYLWVVVEGRGDCIRYYASGLRRGASPQAFVYFHGDWMRQFYHKDKKVFSGYSNYNSPARMQRKADQQRRAAGITGPFVLIARPGVLGSTGDHGDRRLAREVALMNGALAKLKARYRIARFNIAGQSGGGHITASVINLRRDISCAVMSSGVISVARRVSARGWKRDITGHSRYYDPVRHVARAPKGTGLRAFVLGDPKDTNTPFATQKHYADKARRAGLDVTLLTARGSGNSRHGLGPAGRVALRLCAAGAKGGAIQQTLWRQFGKP